jgi:MinD-like ATPase involved in chromosome partitioning or flagellar assembly/CheY-like chemotaxis protein
MPEPIRVLVVEDVPQVAQYIRGLLNAQATIRLIDVMADGTRVAEAVREQRPDILIIDALLQGSLKGGALIRSLREAHLATPMIVLTVPQHPIQSGPDTGIASVLTMPYTGFELVTRIQSAAAEAARAAATRPARVIVLFAPKGGVGRTTIAYNLAVAMNRVGIRPVLVDGSLQFADVRTLLKAPTEAPSILNLPTNNVVESDLESVMWKDSSGIDVLLAPPRVEMAEMVNSRDLQKTISLLRLVYGVVVVDTATVINDVALALLDEADFIVEVLTYDSTTIHNTLAMAEAFIAIGYAPDKIRYLVNRSDSMGGLDPAAVAGMLGRKPEHAICSGGALVVKANNEGKPFVLTDPASDIAKDVVRTAGELLALPLTARSGHR